MQKRSNPKVQVIIEYADNVTVLGDGVHAAGDAIDVKVGTVTNSKFGRDLVHVSAEPDRRSRRRRATTPAPRSIAKTITTSVATVVSISSMVAASGISHALGWL